MKIYILSDNHDHQYTIPVDADLCIHLGDASDGVNGLLLFADKCASLGIDSLVVPGNHDYWHQDYNELYTILDEYKINYLKEGSTYIKDYLTFVGGTLFSNFRSNKKEAWEVDEYKESCSRLRDFSHIVYNNKCITPSIYTTLFNTTLNNINKFRNVPNTVVLSHFPPHPTCSPSIFDPNSSISPYFTNHIDLSGFDYWFFGHTHYNLDTTIDGCRVISNALGFPGEPSYLTFNPFTFIEI